MPLDANDIAPQSPSGAPYRILRPAKQTAPVVFASPHSGRNYPHAFLEAARLDAAGLRRSEDCFVDELFEGAIAAGLTEAAEAVDSGAAAAVLDKWVDAGRAAAG